MSGALCTWVARTPGHLKPALSLAKNTRALAETTRVRLLRKHIAQQAAPAMGTCDASLQRKGAQQNPLQAMLAVVKLGCTKGCWRCSLEWSMWRHGRG